VKVRGTRVQIPAPPPIKRPPVPGGLFNWYPAPVEGQSATAGQRGLGRVPTGLSAVLSHRSPAWAEALAEVEASVEVWVPPMPKAIYHVTYYVSFKRSAHQPEFSDSCSDGSFDLIPVQRPSIMITSGRLR